MSSLVRFEVDRSIAVLTLDSPANRNALSVALMEELRAACATVARDPGVRATVLAADGTTFCAGADLSAPLERYAEAVGGLLADLWAFPKPLVASVGGHVRGGGIGLVAAADVVVASRAATFSFSEVRLGLVPTMVAVLCRPRMTPSAVGRYFLTGEVFGADEARDGGLVTTACEGADLAECTAVVTDALRLGEPDALVGTKAFLRELSGLGIQDGFARAAELSAELVGSPGAVEGLRAFVEKRPPAWVPGPA